MKTKLKLILGVGLLFLLIILLTAVSTWYINALKRDTNNILLANYNTLEYSRNMMLALDEMPNNPEAIIQFETNLHKQRNNETEPLEKETTDKVAEHFIQAKQNPNDSTIKPQIRKDISELMRLNMIAIQTKSSIAAQTAQTAIIWIAFTGTFCFLVAFVLLINLPGSIANPIKELTASIKQIAAQKYSQRVHFESHSEFGELARSFNTMAEKLEEYAGSKIAELLMEKKRIDTLINNMHDPVIGLDENGKVLFTNNEMLKTIGLKKEDIIGESVQQISKTNDLMRILTQDLVKTEYSEQKKEPLKIYVDNKESYFEKEIIGISVTPTGETEKKQIGSVIILKNVTPFKELDFAKTNFIATVSHELKTPISSIQMSTQLLKHLGTGELNKEQSQLIESINEDSSRLLKITGELLNMTQVETGNIQLNIQPSSAYSILQYAIDTTKTQADQKHINLSIDTDANIPNLNIDSEKTAWVLTNFITNAIRYSPEYSEIILSLKKKENRVYYSVKDFGKGIDEKYKEKVFNRYFQVPGSSKAGSGLGLAISKDFIEAQGGNIGVETEQGLGSIFFFSFPFISNNIITSS
ncbi:sensor histidine kinase [Albibacterium bauzanense]|uniref:histidine kinase n=1 Tax=Albibacterium bauzanense TaxID=653929 RepID=A0A4R1LUU9_9SPHI|nr:ATP-binding protein [Albibacterium bauzanense]TCK80953.1 PAS/PAC sensor signal transduction histidine kinase [Albibacterium bauzanense]